MKTKRIEHENMEIIIRGGLATGKSLIAKIIKENIRYLLPLHKISKRDVVIINEPFMDAPLPRERGMVKIRCELAKEKIV